MTKYHQGANYERKLIKQLKEMGASVVIRTAGSHSPIDVVAFFNDCTQIYQVKKTSENKAYFKSDIDKLRKLDIDPEISKFLAVYHTKKADKEKQGWEFIGVE